jgi:DNA-directed RNA polymerase subunit F
MSPLIHQPGSDDADAEVFSPVAVRSAGLRPVHEDQELRPGPAPADDYTWDPKVKAASDHLAELIEIEAPATARSVAQRKLDEVIASVQTRLARERSKTLKAAAAAAKAKVEKARAIEHEIRSSAASPTVTLDFGSVRVVARPEMPMDSGSRVLIAESLRQAERALVREFSNVVGVAKVTGKMSPRSTEHLVGELRDILRHGLKLGAVVIEEIK